MFFRTKANYGEEKEKFVYALSLVFIQCIVNAVFAKAGNFHFLLVFNHLYIIMYFNCKADVYARKSSVDINRVCTES